MRRRFTAATLALVVAVLAALGWWQIGDVRSHSRNATAFHSLTQYVNLVESSGFRVAYDPDPDEREEAREILSIAMGQLSQLDINLSGTDAGFPPLVEIEDNEPETGTAQGAGAGQETGATT